MEAIWTLYKGDCNYFILGSASFLKKVCDFILDKNKVVSCFEHNFEDKSRVGRRQWSLVVTTCKTLGFSPVTMADMQFGDGIDARFLFGFGDSLSSPHLPEAQADV